MNSKRIIIFVLLIALSGAISAKSTAKDGEIEVKLQFLEYELEDLCIAKNEAEWKFLNGTDPNLKKLLDIEIRESQFYKTEMEILQKHVGKKFKSESLQRLMSIFSQPGAPLLGNAEFKEYRDYSIKLDEMIGTMEIVCPYDLNTTKSKVCPHSHKSEVGERKNMVHYNTINKILYSDKNPDKLKSIWVKWFQEMEKKNSKTKYDFVQQLSILDLEAEQNGEEELSDYWLKISDITWVNYDSAKSLWNEIIPLYNKLKHFIISLAIQNFGADVVSDNKLIPAHILGSLKSYDWVTAAEKLGAFDHSDAYHDLKLSLAKKNVKELYKMADNMTTEFGRLSQGFYEKSRFDESGDRCRSQINRHCTRKNVQKVMFCSEDDLSVNNFLKITENTMKIKYFQLCSKEEEENGYLTREGPRDSVLYEAIESLSSLRALQTDNLQNHQIFTSRSDRKKQEILSLFIGALHVIPSLPYYLVSDLWRINALKEMDLTIAENVAETTSFSPVFNNDQNNNNNTNLGEPYETTKAYDTKNLTMDWWNYRRQYQGIGSPDGKPHEDYLQDRNIIWNKPYLSKFLGKLLQFQILEHLKKSGNVMDLPTLMRKGKSKPWQLLVEDGFNITQISAESLLNYFKPLEDFLDEGIKFKNDTHIFTKDDFNFIPQSYSLAPVNVQRKGSKVSGTSDVIFFSLTVIAAVGIVAVILTIGRRRYKKRQRRNERSRRMADL